MPLRHQLPGAGWSENSNPTHSQGAVKSPRRHSEDPRQGCEGDGGVRDGAEVLSLPPGPALHQDPAGPADVTSATWWFMTARHVDGFPLSLFKILLLW